MFSKVLVANRGEVALRVMRACKELGVKTVAVYSIEDADTYPVRYADEAVCIGPAQANKSYLVIPSIIAAAKNTGAEAVHPGYGFLAENADFARACADNDLVFVASPAACIERMGDKSRARETMRACGVPTVPGSDGCIDTAEEAKKFADKVGYPVLIKATAGGGGKGMREGTTRPTFGGPLPCRPHRGGRGIRQRRGVSREARGSPAPRRSAGARRRFRQQRFSVRARLLSAAPSSEAYRGGAFARA